MRKIIIIFYIPLLLFAQEDSHQIAWKSTFFIESNSLERSFLQKMLYGGYINNELKNKWINASKEKNIMHAEISNILSYNYNFKKQGITLSIADRNLITTNFTNDLLRIIFEGNYNYQQDTLFFNNTNIQADRFQQYKLKYSIGSEKLNINTGLSYIAGNHKITYIIEEGSLYTSEFGSNLNINYDMVAFVTDTSNFSLFANNGNGLAIDLSSNFKIKDYKIMLSITDLGFIMWKYNSIQSATDSTFDFQGIEVENLLSFNDSVLDNKLLQENLLKNRESSFKSYLPATIQMSISGKTKHKYFKTYNAGIITKWNPYIDNTPLSLNKIQQGFNESHFKPLYYLKSKINIKNIELFPRLSYGGYSEDINFGLAFSKGKKHKIIIGTQHLEELLNKEEAKSTSLFLEIKSQF